MQYSNSYELRMVNISSLNTECKQSASSHKSVFSGYHYKDDKTYCFTVTALCFPLTCSHHSNQFYPCRSPAECLQMPFIIILLCPRRKEPFVITPDCWCLYHRSPRVAGASRIIAWFNMPPFRASCLKMSKRVKSAPKNHFLKSVSVFFSLWLISKQHVFWRHTEP